MSDTTTLYTRILQGHVGLGDDGGKGRAPVLDAHSD